VSNHIVSHQDFGEFLHIKHLRVRKDLILSYQVVEDQKLNLGGVPITHFYLCIFTGNGTHSILYTTREEADIEAQRLDWIYKKDGKNHKE